MRSMNNLLLLLACIGFTACVGVSPDLTTPKSHGIAVKLKPLEVGPIVCRPGEQKCEFACQSAGGPRGDDCIIPFDDDGAGWTTIEDCGGGLSTAGSALVDSTRGRSRSVLERA